MLIHFLTCTFDGVLLGVQQVLHEENQLDLPTLVDAVARSILGRAQKAELAFPVSQHVRLEIRELTDLADAEEFLDRFAGAHASRSARNSRDISSETPL